MCLPRKIMLPSLVCVERLPKLLQRESVCTASCCNDPTQFRAVGLFVCVFVGGATVVDEASPHVLRGASWFEGVAQRCQAFSGIRSVRRAVVRHLGDFYSCPAQKPREG